MDKRKLVNIIVKDLEEIKILSEEVADNEDGSALIIDLALYRARLLCQEIELLRTLAIHSPSMETEADQFSIDKDEEQVSALHFPDPELEILNFEDQNEEFSATEEMPEEQELIATQEEDEEEFQNLGDDLEDENDLVEEDSELEETIEENEEEIEEDDLEEDELVEIDEDEKDVEETEVIDQEIAQEEEKIVEEIKVEEKPLPGTKIQITELKSTPQPGVREINIDELDDEDDIEPIRITPATGSNARPQMREIPKPEFTKPETPEKLVVGEKYHKERSLNDSMAEKKPLETPLINNRISSLRAAIGLNDRFLFIREIFENNTEKYNQVIEQLDKMERIQEAVEYLKANLSMQKNEASMKFVDLLKRRFTP